MDRVMDVRSDRGFTVAELMVTVTLVFIVLAAVYSFTSMVQASERITSRQSLFVRNVTTPLHTLDKVLSQNKAIENNGTYISDPYTLTARSPIDPLTNTYTRHVFQATSDGRLTETVYTQAVGSATPTLLRTVEWSDSNANRTKGALFTYLGASGETTPAAQARSVLLQVWVKDGDYYYSGKRQVFFRNR